MHILFHSCGRGFRYFMSVETDCLKCTSYFTAVEEGLDIFMSVETDCLKCTSYFTAVEEGLDVFMSVENDTDFRSSLEVSTV